MHAWVEVDLDNANLARRYHFDGLHEFHDRLPGAINPSTELEARLRTECEPRRLCLQASRDSTAQAALVASRQHTLTSAAVAERCDNVRGTGMPRR